MLPLSATSLAQPLARLRSFSLTAALVLPLSFIAWSSFARVSAEPAAPPLAVAAPHTMLDEVGRFGDSVSGNLPIQLQKDLVHDPAETPQIDNDHIWYGEYLLAHDEQPVAADRQFYAVSDSKQASPAARGLAAYDEALADFYRGAYSSSADDFNRLLQPKSGLTGFPLKNCALWYRHAVACAGYHDSHAKVGIPEPVSLDPLCGAAAIASSLKSLGLPFDKKSVVDIVKPTGEGNSFGQLISAGPAFHVHIRSVKADDIGLQNLPKPLIAYVEQDHFVSVTAADASGVTYLCSDCGAWPGGVVHLTWVQWHTMDAGVYGVVTVPGGRWDKIMDQVLAASGRMESVATEQSDGGAAAGVEVASSIFPSGMSTILDQLRVVNLLKLHVFEWMVTGITCGNKPNALHCDPAVKCPMDCPAGSPGDPVNLANGEEEYTPAADITVYNPCGPSVTWRRLYNSLRGFSDVNSYSPGSNTGLPATPALMYDYDDYGLGWSTNYNIGILDTSDGTPSNTSAWRYILMPDGARVGFQFTNATLINNVYTINVPAEEMVVTYSTVGKYYVVTLQDHSEMTFAELNSSSPDWNLQRIYDKFGNYIQFDRGTQTGPSGWPLLNGITNSQQTALLSINRTPGAPYTITSITDNSSRTVYYNSPYEGYITNYGNVNALSQVSVVLPSGTSSPFTGTNLMYAYGYIALTNLDAEETAPTLSTIGIQSASTPGAMATTTINYNNAQNTEPVYVTSLVDPYGNTRTYNNANSTATTVDVTGSSKVGTYDVAGTPANSNDYGGPIYNYNVNEATTSVTDLSAGMQSPPPGSDIVQLESFSGTNDPYEPTFLEDGNAVATNTGSFLVSPLIPAGTSTVVSLPSPSALVTYPGNAPSSPQWYIYYPGGTTYSSRQGYSTGGWSVQPNGNSVAFVKSPSSLTASQVQYVVKVQYWYPGTMPPTTQSFSGTFEVGDAHGALPGVTQIQWDPYGHPQTVVSARGAKTQVVYTDTSAVGLPEEISQSLGNTPLVNPTSLYYETLSNGNQGLLALPTSRDILSSVQTPAPGETYPSTGSNATTSLYYDWQNTTGYPTNQGTLGNVVGIVMPGNNNTSAETETFTYTTGSQTERVDEPLSITDAAGDTTYYQYDQYNNISSYTDAMGNVTTSQYNIDDQIAQHTYPGGKQFVLYFYAYQNNGQPTTNGLPIINQGGGPLTDEQLWDTNAGGTPYVFREVKYAYGPAGDVRSATAINHLGGSPASSVLASYTYDALFRLASVTDGNGHTTNYQYNEQGYFCNTAYPDASLAIKDNNGLWEGFDTVRYGCPVVVGSDTYQGFDNDGNPLTRTDGRGVSATYFYDDPESLLTWVNYYVPAPYASLVSSMPPATTYPSSNFSYDSFGRMKSANDTAESAYWSFDDAGNVTNLNKNYYLTPTGASQFAASWSNSYWPDGTPSSKNVTVGTTSYPFNYYYDNDQRLTGETNPAGRETDYTYYPNGWLQTQVDYDGYRTNGPLVSTNSYAYNARGFMTDLQEVSPTTLLTEFGTRSNQYVITYDAAGNRTSTPVYNPDYSQLQGTTNYAYDYKNQLTQESSSINGGYTNNYAYDNAGNPTTFRNVSGLAYNNDNEISPGGNSYAYDGDGNPTTYKAYTFQFDPENRPTTVYNGSAPQQYTAWGPDGQVAWQEQNSTYYFYLYDGDELLGIQSAPSGGPTPNGLSYYQTFGSNGLDSTTSGSSTSYWNYDAQGAVEDNSVDNGQTYWPSFSDAYGMLAGTGTSITQSNNGVTYPLIPHIDFQEGALPDTTATLPFTIMGHRLFDSQNGRFLTRDPIGMAGGLNLYAYCGDNPIARTDPDGLDWRDDAGTWIDNNLLNGAVGNLGTDVGNFDSGCGNALKLTEDSASLVFQVGTLVVPGGEEAKGAELAERELVDEAPEVGAEVTNYVPDLENAFKDTVSKRQIVVDPYGNAIPVEPGEHLTGSANGEFIQVRGEDGIQTGVRIDGPHNPMGHPDPRAQAPHGHVPGLTNDDGTPWLPINQ